MKPFLYASFFMLSCCVFAQSTAPPSSPADPAQGMPSRQADGCPIHVQEAYLASDHVLAPTQEAKRQRVLHVTLTDASGKPITSYVLHARIARPPAGSVTPGLGPAEVTRSWKGHLAPDEPAKEQWRLPAAQYSASLERLWFDKVTFQDGTSWNKSPNDDCSYHPMGRIVQTGKR